MPKTCCRLRTDRRQPSGYVKDGKHYGSWCMASYARVDGGQKSVLERALAAPIPVPREPGHTLKKATKVIAAARAFNAAGAAAQAAAAAVGTEHDGRC